MWLASAVAGSGEPFTPKFHLYVSGVLPSGSVAVEVKSTFSGATPVTGVADAVTVGRWLSVAPWPMKSTQLTLSR